LGTPREIKDQGNRGGMPAESLEDAFLALVEGKAAA
jgi:hypothetical protein